MVKITFLIIIITSYSFANCQRAKISGAVATTDSFFALIGSNLRGTAVELMNGKTRVSKTLTVEVNAKQSIKRQLYTTQVGAVGSEPHSSSTTTCAGKVDHELPVNQSKGHTYTNPRAHALRLTHIYYSTCIFSFFQITQVQPWSMCGG